MAASSKRVNRPGNSERNTKPRTIAASSSQSTTTPIVVSHLTTLIGILNDRIATVEDHKTAIDKSKVSNDSKLELLTNEQNTIVTSIDSRENDLKAIFSWLAREDEGKNSDLLFVSNGSPSYTDLVRSSYDAYNSLVRAWKSRVDKTADVKNIAQEIAQLEDDLANLTSTEDAVTIIPSIQSAALSPEELEERRRALQDARERQNLDIAIKTKTLQQKYTEFQIILGVREFTKSMYSTEDVVAWWETVSRSLLLRDEEFTLVFATRDQCVQQKQLIEAQLNSSQIELDELKIHLRNLEEINTTLSNYINENRLSSDEITKINTQLKSLTSDSSVPVTASNARLSSLLEKVKLQLSTYEQARTLINNDRETLRKNIKDNTNSLAILSEQLNIMRNERTESRQRTTLILEKLAISQRQLKSATSRRTAVESQLKEITREETNLNANVDDLADRIIELSNEVNFFKRQVREQQAMLDEQTRTITQLRIPSAPSVEDFNELAIKSPNMQYVIAESNVLYMIVNPKFNILDRDPNSPGAQHRQAIQNALAKLDRDYPNPTLAEETRRRNIENFVNNVSEFLRDFEDQRRLVENLQRDNAEINAFYEESKQISGFEEAMQDLQRELSEESPVPLNQEENNRRLTNLQNQIREILEAKENQKLQFEKIMQDRQTLINDIEKKHNNEKGRVSLSISELEKQLRQANVSIGILQIRLREGHKSFETRARKGNAEIAQLRARINQNNFEFQTKLSQRAQEAAENAASYLKLQSDLQNSTERARSLQEQLNEANKSRQSLETLIGAPPEQQLTKIQQTLQASITKIEQDLRTRKTELDNLNRLYAEASDRYNILVNSRAQAQREVAQTSSFNTEELRKSQQANEDLRRALDRLTAEHQRLLAEKTALSSNANVRQETETRLQSEITDLNTRLTSSSAAARAEISMLEQNLKDAQLQISKLRLQLKNESKTYADLDKRQTKILSNETLLAVERNQAVDKYNKAVRSIGKLENDISKLRSELDIERSRLAVKTQEYAELSNEADIFTKYLTELRTENANLLNNEGSILRGVQNIYGENTKRILSKYKDALDDLEFSALQSAKWKGLYDESVENFTNLQNQWLERSKETQDRYTTIVNELEVSQVTLRQLERETATAQSESSKVIQDLTDQRDALNIQLHDADNQLATITLEKTQLETNIHDLRGINASSISQLRALEEIFQRETEASKKMLAEQQAVLQRYENAVPVEMLERMHQGVNKYIADEIENAKNALVQENAALQSLNASITQDLTKARNEISTLETKTNALNAQWQRLLNDDRFTIDANENQRRDLSSFLEDIQERMRLSEVAHTEQLETLENDFNSKQRELNDALMEARELSRNLRDTNAQSESVRTAEREAYLQQIINLESLVQTNIQDLSDINDETPTQEIELLRSQTEELQQKLENERRQFEQSDNSYKLLLSNLQAQLDIAQDNENDSLQLQRENETRHAQELNDLNTKINNERTAWKEVRTNLENTRNELESTISNLRESLDNSQKSQREAISSLENTHRELLAAQEEREYALRGQLEQNANTIRENEVLISSSDTEIRALLQQVANANEDLENTRQTLSRTQEELKETLNGIEQRQRLFDIEQLSAQQRIRSLEEQIAEAQNQLSDNVERLTEVNSDLREREEQILILNTEITTLNAEIAEQTLTAQTQEENNQRREEHIALLETTIHENQETIDLLNSQLSSARERIEELAEADKERSDRQEEIEEELEGVKKSIERLNLENEENEAKRRELEERFQSEQDHKREIEEKLRAELEEATRKLQKESDAVEDIDERYEKSEREFKVENEKLDQYYEENYREIQKRKNTDADLDLSEEKRAKNKPRLDDNERERRYDYYVNRNISDDIGTSSVPVQQFDLITEQAQYSDLLTELDILDTRRVFNHVENYILQSGVVDRNVFVVFDAFHMFVDTVAGMTAQENANVFWTSQHKGEKALIAEIVEAATIDTAAVSALDIHDFPNLRPSLENTLRKVVSDYFLTNRQAPLPSSLIVPPTQPIRHERLIEVADGTRRLIDATPTENTLQRIPLFNVNQSYSQQEYDFRQVIQQTVLPALSGIGPGVSFKVSEPTGGDPWTTIPKGTSIDDAVRSLAYNITQHLHIGRSGDRIIRRPTTLSVRKLLDDLALRRTLNEVSFSGQRYMDINTRIDHLLNSVVDITFYAAFKVSLAKLDIPFDFTNPIFYGALKNMLFAELVGATYLYKRSCSTQTEGRDRGKVISKLGAMVSSHLETFRSIGNRIDPVPIPTSENVYGSQAGSISLLDYNIKRDRDARDRLMQQSTKRRRALDIFL
jgi:chromosome segregation ATPase